jgi:hypothetical protein
MAQEEQTPAQKAEDEKVSKEIVEKGRQDRFEWGEGDIEIERLDDED